jgi:hypothetical protein
MSIDLQRRARIFRRARIAVLAAVIAYFFVPYEVRAAVPVWLLLLAALAPLILAWILVRGHRLSWTPGEMTMVAGFAAMVLIGYNGIIDRPGTGPAEIGVSLDYGYWLALLAAIVIAGTGFTRSLESGERKTRKAPGTV